MDWLRKIGLLGFTLKVQFFWGCAQIKLNLISKSFKIVRLLQKS